MHTVNLDIKYLSLRMNSFGGGVFSSQRRQSRPQPRPRQRPFSAQVIAEVLDWLRNDPERHIQQGASRNYIPVLNYIVSEELFNYPLIVDRIIREIRAFQESPREYNRVRAIHRQQREQTARINNPLLVENDEEDIALPAIRDTERMLAIERRRRDPRRRIITQSHPSTIRPQRNRSL
jgi:hypothetical protein